MSRAHLVHSHTWYANLAGHLAALLYGMPHVMTMHSLEPLRPWKAEQLGGGYAPVQLVRAGGGRRRPPRSSRCPTACGPTCWPPTPRYLPNGSG